jgi:hypothetical protein
MSETPKLTKEQLKGKKKIFEGNVERTPDGFRIWMRSAFLKKSLLPGKPKASLIHPSRDDVVKASCKYLLTDANFNNIVQAKATKELEAYRTKVKGNGQVSNVLFDYNYKLFDYPYMNLSFLCLDDLDSENGAELKINVPTPNDLLLDVTAAVQAFARASVQYYSGTFKANLDLYCDENNQIHF